MRIAECSILQLTQRALTASDADAKLFVDRDAELATIERSLDLKFNVYLAGPAGSGKTSTLRRLQARLRAGMPVQVETVGFGVNGHERRELERVYKFVELCLRLNDYSHSSSPSSADISAQWSDGTPVAMHVL